MSIFSKKTLGYDYLGDWTDRPDNRNIDTDLLRTYLKKTRKYDDTLINRALFIIEKVAGNTGRSLYDRNKDFYELLRYGVKVKPEVGGKYQNRLVD